MKRRGVPSERNAAVQVRSSKPLDMDVCLKALVNEDTLLRTHCCGHIVAHDVSEAAQTGKHLLRTQNVSEQN